MNVFRTLAIARKEARQIIRDKRSLWLALGIPVMLMFLFGYALSLDVDNIPTAFWDQDNTPESEKLMDRLTSSGYFRRERTTCNYRDIVGAIDSNHVSVGVIIPHDLAKKLEKGQTSHIQVIVDGSDSTRASIAIVYVESIIAGFEADYQYKALVGQSVEKRVAPPVEAKVRLVYNPELKSRNNIVPGLVAIIMMVIAALLTSLTVVRERETGHHGTAYINSTSAE